MILQSTYNGPVQYFARIVKEEQIVIEQHDHYLKQTYRNRCRILGANGPLALTIPVINIPGEKTLMKDIRIDYAISWQKVHFKGIESAYASAPFFEFIIDDLESFYSKKFDFLIDYNHRMLDTILSILEIQCTVSCSESFTPIAEDGSDPRFIVHPKKDFYKSDPQFNPVPYNQVFIEKHGFIPNLSILDLLFNEGMNAKTILLKSLLSDS